MPEFDVVIVGSGPGGATAAEALTDAGKSVCLLEKGRNHLLDAGSRRSRRSATSRATRSSSAAGTSSVRIHCSSRARTAARPADGDRLFVGECNNMPSTLGGAGYHADGKLPRFREVDFRLASEHGAVDGADIADWPLDYDELEPFYADAERIIGVAGDTRATPSRRGAAARTRCRRAPTCSSRR